MKNNPVQLMMSFMQNGGDAENFAKQLFNENPQMVQTMNQLKNMAGDMSPRDFAYQIGKQQGYSTEQIDEIAKRIGAK